MPSLNPNHPLSQQVSDAEAQQKLMAILVMKLGGRIELSVSDVNELSSLFGGEVPVLVTWGHSESLELKLVPMREAKELARTAGGLAN